MYGEEQQLKPTQRKLLDEVYARLDVWEQGDRFYHERAKTIREVIHCNDPGQDPPPKEGQRTPDKPTLQLQTLKATYNNAVAEQMLNLPDAKLTSETAEQAECVEDLQDILHHVIYNTNDYETVHRRLAEDFLGPGTAIVQVAWDDDMANGKGDVKILRWPIEAFLWDPQCEDIQDSRAVMKVGWHPLSWFAEHYPEQAEYICGEEGQHNNVGVPTAQYDKTAGDEDRAMLVEYWYRKYDARKHRYTINVCVCAGGALLDEQEGVYDHGMYPFVVCAHSTIEGCFAGDGMVEELVPMMRYINRYAAYIDENLRMASKGRLLVREDSGIDREALADWSQDMIEGKGVVKGQDWDWLSHEPMNGMAVSMMQIFQGDLKADSGYNSATRGEAVGGVGYTSGKAYLAMQQAGGKIASMRGQVLQGMFRRMAEQVLWLISQFYDDKRIVIVTGRDNANRQVTMDARKYFGFDKRKPSPRPRTPFVLRPPAKTRRRWAQ